jgi:hypothetical protein
MTGKTITGSTPPAEKEKCLRCKKALSTTNRSVQTQCDLCKKYFHNICIIYPEEARVAPYVCPECNDAQTQKSCKTPRGAFSRNSSRPSMLISQIPPFNSVAASDTSQVEDAHPSASTSTQSDQQVTVQDDVIIREADPHLLK